MIPNCKQNNANYKEVKNRVNKLSTYSTEEQVIGTWIDGKPLYRTTFTFDISNDKFLQWVDIPHHINNVQEMWVKMWYSLDSSGNHYILPDIHSQIKTNVNNISYVITQESGYGGNGSRVIVEYTKTTD